MSDWISKGTNDLLFFLLKVQMEISFSVILFKMCKIPWWSNLTGIYYYMLYIKITHKDEGI